MTYKFIEKRGKKDRVRARLSSIYIVPFFRYEKRGNQERLYLKLYGGLAYGSVAVERVRSNRSKYNLYTSSKVCIFHKIIQSY